jgi:hypothetical protein
LKSAFRKMSRAKVSRSFSGEIVFLVILAMALMTHLKMMINSSTDMFPLQSKSNRRKTARRVIRDLHKETSNLVEECCIGCHQNPADNLVNVDKCFGN